MPKSLKSIPATVAALTVALLLAACGSSTGGGTSSSVAGDSTSVTTPSTVTPTETTAPSTGTTGTTATGAASPATALSAAYQVETAALATYRNVLRRLGTVRPFANIARAEQTHVSTISKLAAAHGVKLPAASAGVTSPATLRLACQLGVRNERNLITLYDAYIPRLGAQPDLQRAFENIRSASAKDHLPAFQHCT